MSMGAVDGKLIPAFVTARSPLGLRRAMLINNAKAGAFHRYFDIQFVQGQWYAWFFKEVGADDVSVLDESDQRQTR